MNEALDQVTLRIGLLALDAAMLRQQAHAANIANAANPDYAPASVRFDTQLERARMDLLESGGIAPSSLSGVQPVLLRQPAMAGAGAEVRLDAEVAGMAYNGVLYQSLSTALSRYLGIMAMAVADGRR